MKKIAVAVALGLVNFSLAYIFNVHKDLEHMEYTNDWMYAVELFVYAFIWYLIISWLESKQRIREY